VHPTLKMIGLYLSTLAHNGVPAKNRHIAAMFHQVGGDAVFSNEIYKARHLINLQMCSAGHFRAHSIGTKSV